MISTGQTISKSELSHFHDKELALDDVWQQSFNRNVIFYGSNESDVQVATDALAELKSWGVGTQTFIAGARIGRSQAWTIRLLQWQDGTAIESISWLQCRLYDHI